MLQRVRKYREGTMSFYVTIRKIFHKKPSECTQLNKVDKFINNISSSYEQRILKNKIVKAHKEQKFRKPENVRIKKLVNIGIAQLRSIGVREVEILSALMGIGVYELNYRLRTRKCLDDGLGCTPELDWAGYASYQKFKDDIDYLFFTTPETGLSPQNQQAPPSTVLVYRGLSFGLPQEPLSDPQQFIKDKLGINNDCYIEPGLSFATPFKKQANEHPTQKFLHRYSDKHKTLHHVTLKIHGYKFISLPDSNYLPPDLLDLVSITDHAKTLFNVIFPPNSHFHIHNIFTAGNHTEIDIIQK